LVEARAKNDQPHRGTGRVVPGDQADPLDAKELAKAKLVATHADPQKLVVAKLEAARIVNEAYEKEFMAGRGTLFFLFDSARCLLEAERAVYKQQIDQVGALERYWQRANQRETISREWMEEGRTPVKDYAACRYVRLEAEIWLQQARAKEKQPRTLGVAVPLG